MSAPVRKYVLFVEDIRVCRTLASVFCADLVDGAKRLALKQAAALQAVAYHPESTLIESLSANWKDEIAYYIQNPADFLENLLYHPHIKLHLRLFSIIRMIQHHESPFFFILTTAR